jgi:para-aminobenzoate synthetase component 1
MMPRVGVPDAQTDINGGVLPWNASPLALLNGWPTDRRVVMVHSGRRHRRWARWSILAAPVAWYRFDGGRSSVCGTLPVPTPPLVHDPLHDLDGLLHATRPFPAGRQPELPFVGGWIGFLSYDLARQIEPTAVAAGGAEDDRGWALVEMAYCPGALVYDNRSGTWHAVGDVGLASVPCPSLPPRIDPPVPASAGAPSLRSSMPCDRYQAAVRRCIEYIAAGDVFQVNIAQRLTAEWTGSTRQLAQQALERSGAWYGAYIEGWSDHCLLSLSPELFLEVDPASRRVVTRPVKGTRPSRASPQELETSAKDAAELHMIIDLMRNDLGRVCRFGSIRVPRGRTIESHPTVHHGVGEVVGTLRDGVSTGDLLRATFPGGSVTGAPKIRAMQIIDELEPVRRGPYCGAVGYFSDCGRACLNIAIRTLALTGRRSPGCFDRLDGVLDYSAGGAVVADSDPRGEYRESLDKAAILSRVLEEGTEGMRE